MRVRISVAAGCTVYFGTLPDSDFAHLIEAKDYYICPLDQQNLDRGYLAVRPDKRIGNESENVYLTICNKKEGRLKVVLKRMEALAQKEPSGTNPGRKRKIAAKLTEDLRLCVAVDFGVERLPENLEPF